MEIWKGKSDKYKGVYKKVANGKDKIWHTQFYYKNVKYQKYSETERGAAIKYDKIRIELGLEPVNILLKK